MEGYPKFIVNDVKFKVAAARMGFWIGVSEKAKRIEDFAKRKAEERQTEIIEIAFDMASQMFI